MACTAVCECNNSLSNTGTDCQPIFEVAKRLIFVPTYDSTGTRNFINLADTLDAAYFLALVNEADSSKRWYPSPEIKNIESLREDPIYETFADNSRIFIQQGVKNFSGILVGKDASPQLVGKLESLRCNDVSAYVVDRKGNLRGTISNDGTQLFPIKIDAASVSPTLADTTDTTGQKIILNFTWSQEESDSCLRMISANEMGDANLLNLRGLLNVFATFSGISQTGATLKLTTDYGTPINPTVVRGLVTNDFISSVTASVAKVRNTTDTLDVTVTVTESSSTPGTYVLAWASQTVSDVIVVAIKKNGFDFTAVAASPITIV